SLGSGFESRGAYHRAPNLNCSGPFLFHWGVEKGYPSTLRLSPSGAIGPCTPFMPPESQKAHVRAEKASRRLISRHFPYTLKGYRPKCVALDGVSLSSWSVLPILFGSRVLPQRLRGCRSGRARSARCFSSVFWE